MQPIQNEPNWIELQITIDRTAVQQQTAERRNPPTPELGNRDELE
jgi:hypothetical protein